jgi:hypothetical protein
MTTEIFGQRVQRKIRAVFDRPLKHRPNYHLGPVKFADPHVRPTAAACNSQQSAAELHRRAFSCLRRDGGSNRTIWRSKSLPSSTKRRLREIEADIVKRMLQFLRQSLVDHAHDGRRPDESTTSVIPDFVLDRHRNGVASYSHGGWQPESFAKKGKRTLPEVLNSQDFRIRCFSYFADGP